MNYLPLFVSRNFNEVTDIFFCCGTIQSTTNTKCSMMALSPNDKHRKQMTTEVEAPWLSLPRGGGTANPFGHTAVGNIIHTLECKHKGGSGILYITERAVCYRSINLFGLEIDNDRVIIPFGILSGIGKEKQSIVIETAIKEHEFSEVQEIDNIITLLNQTWKNANSFPPSPLQKLAVDTMFRRITTLTASESESLSFSDVEDTNNDSDSILNSKDVWDEFVKKKCGNGEIFAHTVVKNMSIDCSLEDFYDMFLGDNSPSSIGTIHEQIGDSDVQVTNWESTKDCTIMKRCVTFTHPLDILFCPQSCRNEKTQKLQTFGDHGICVMSNTLTQDLSISDYFRLKECMLVESKNDGGVSISIMFDVCFLQSTLMKSLILKIIIKDSFTFHNHFIKCMKDQCSKLKKDNTNDASKNEWDTINEYVTNKNYNNKVAVNSSFNCNLDQFYNTFLAEDCEFSLDDFHQRDGDTDVKVTKWADVDKFKSQRTITYKHPVNAPGISYGLAEKSQTLYRFRDHGLCVISKTVTQGVPLADCFYIEDCLLVSSNDGGGISVTRMFDICFTSSTIFKKVISITTTTELLKFHNGFTKFLNQGLSNYTLSTPSLDYSANDDNTGIMSIVHDSHLNANDTFTSRKNLLEIMRLTLVQVCRKVSAMEPFVLGLVFAMLLNQFFLLSRIKRLQDNLSMVEESLVKHTERKNNGIDSFYLENSW